MLALEPGSRNARFSRKSRIQKRSNHQWVQHGTVYITDPPREKYADLISINGTDYTDDGRGDMVYRDERGRALDFSSFGE